MIIRIKLDNLKAVSTNSIYKGMGKRRKKTDEYKYLEQVVKFEMLKNRSNVLSLFSDFNKRTDCVKVKVYNELKNLVIEKSSDKDRVGCISLTCLDVDNSFKGLIDSVFKQIGINDAEICAIEGYKFQSEQNCNNIYIELEIINRGKLWQKLAKHLKADINKEQ